MTGDLFEAPAAPRVERDQLEIHVVGTPKPKGSMRAFVVGKENPRAVVTHGNDSQGLKLWHECVVAAAMRAMADRTRFIDRPLLVHLVFRMPRPVGHLKVGGGLTRSAPRFPATKPDIDKLVRSTLDALQGPCFDDDSRVVSLAANKIYADDGPPGADVVIREMP